MNYPAVGDSGTRLADRHRYLSHFLSAEAARVRLTNSPTAYRFYLRALQLAT